MESIDKARLIHEAILNDRVIHQLQIKRFKLYSVAMPIVILIDGNSHTIRLDETNHPLLPEIEKMIEERTQQIINSLN